MTIGSCTWKDYLGCVIPNFWGTLFTLYDAGADVGCPEKVMSLFDGTPDSNPAKI